MSFPYSSKSYTTVNSTTTDFSYSDVPLLADVPHKDQLKVYENGQLRTLNNTGADNYTLVVASELVRFNSTRASGVTIKIARSTDIENKEVTFTNSSVLTAQDLNKNSDQLLFLCQELYDKAQDISLTAVGEIPANSIGEDKLNQSSGTEAVVTTAIRDDAVTTAKIDDEAVTAAKLGTSAVETAKIQDGAVTNVKIADTTIEPGKLSTGAPTWTTGGNVTVTGNATITGDAAVDGVMSFDSGYGSTAPVYGCRAWVNFNGSAGSTVGGEFRCTIRASANIAKVVRTSTGDYTVHFTTAMTDANYCVVTSARGSNGDNAGDGQGFGRVAFLSSTNYTTSAFNLRASGDIGYVGYYFVGSYAGTNPTICSVAVFR